MISKRWVEEFCASSYLPLSRKLGGTVLEFQTTIVLCSEKQDPQTCSFTHESYKCKLYSCKVNHGCNILRLALINAVCAGRIEITHTHVA